MSLKVQENWIGSKNRYGVCGACHNSDVAFQILSLFPFVVENGFIFL
jgi:hypothetical protein